MRVAWWGRASVFELLLLAGAFEPGSGLATPIDSLVDQRARVRVTSASLDPSRRVGTLLALRRDSLAIFEASQAETLWIPTARITRMDVSRSTRSHGMRGLTIGTLTGALVGALLVGPVVGSSLDRYWEKGGSAHSTAIAFVVVGGVAGGLLGHLIGTAWVTDDWEEMSLP